MSVKPNHRTIIFPLVPEQQGRDLPGLEQQREPPGDRLLRRLRAHLVDDGRAEEHAGAAQGTHLRPQVEQERELHSGEACLWHGIYNMNVYRMLNVVKGWVKKGAENLRKPPDTNIF